MPRNHIIKAITSISHKHLHVPNNFIVIDNNFGLIYNGSQCTDIERNVHSRN